MTPDFSNLDFSARRSVIAAVSGGSDSVAMLVLLKDYVSRLPSPPELIAVTVDHGLRAASAGEAVSVAQLCKTLDVKHATMRWTDAKPDTGLPAAARAARYRLLAEAASAEGSDLIVTGHTADDQAETVAMRRQRGDGRGLAGMAPATLYDGKVWIARPLLGTRRSALRSMLSGRGLGWLDDPTNVDVAYERARLRQRLDGDDVGGLLQIAKEAAADRVALGEAAAVLIDDLARQVAPGLVRFDLAILEAAAEPAIYALRLLLAVLGGVPQLPERDAVANLFDDLRGAKPRRATLSRVLIDRRRNGLFLCREARGLPEEMPAADGMVWDGRFRLTQGGAAEAWESAGDVAGHDVARVLESDAAATYTEAVPDSLRGIAAGSQPRLNRAGQRDAKDTGWTATPLLAPFAGFLPFFDLVAAASLARLVGAAPPPAPPFTRHKLPPA